MRAGKLRALAVTGEKRSRTMPDVPALAEQGFNGCSVLAWGAVFGPAGVPKPVLDKFHGELVKRFNQPGVRNQLGDQLGMNIVASGPAALRTFLAGEIERWGKVIRENNIRAE